MSQLEQFKRLPCYKCMDPVKENIPIEDLPWDSFQMVHSEQDSVYETPNYMNEKKQIENMGHENRSLGLNSFGTAIDTLRHLVDLELPIDPYVEELLEAKRCLQEQLQEISSEGTSIEDKGRESTLPPTLGEHQMQYLGNWQSIRNILEPKSECHPQLNSQYPVEEIDTHPQQSPHEYEARIPQAYNSSAPNTPSRFSQVAHLKEYLQLNIKILQDQIDWNSHKIHTEDLVKDQGTSMTPKVQTERGVNTEKEPFKEMPQNEETQFCFHCLTHGHRVYRCAKPGKERAIAWLHQQESIIDYCKNQKLKHQLNDSDIQKLDAIATTRRLTNPHGKDWCDKEMPAHQHNEIGKHISQGSRRGLPINSSSQITPNSHLTPLDKLKNNTFTENNKRNLGCDPQFTDQTLVKKECVIPSSHKRIAKQTVQLGSKQLPGNNGVITGDQLTFNSVPVVLTRQSHDDTGKTSIYNMKETFIPSSHKQIIEQTPQSYGVITPENHKVITGDQLPFNEVTMRQFRDGRVEAFNDKTNNYTPTQTHFTNEASTSESGTLEDPQLPISPVNVRLDTPNKEIKRNVQFHTPENT